MIIALLIAYAFWATFTAVCLGLAAAYGDEQLAREGR